MKQYVKSLLQNQRTLILYGAIGITGATLDFVLYLLFYKALGIPPFAASFLSVSLAIANNFILNARYNFKVSGKFISRFASFYLTGVGGAILSALLILFFFNFLSVDATIAKLITIPPVVLLQFIINKNVSFSDDPGESFYAFYSLLKTHWVTLSALLLGSFFYFSSIIYLVSPDEIDNILGGKLILDGIFPYTGFFSHHAPGMYFVAALLQPVVQDDVFAFRLLFNLLTFCLLLTTFFYARRVTGLGAAVYFLLACIGHSVAYSHLALGESLIAALLPLLILLLVFPHRQVIGIKLLVVLSVSLFVIPFVSITYVFAALVLYLLIAIKIFRQQTSRSRLPQRLVGYASALVAPYIIAGTVVAVSGGFSALKYDLLTFNAHIYASMVGEQGGEALKSFASMIFGTLQQLGEVGRNILNPDYTVQVLLLIGFLLFCMYLWQTGKKIEAVVVLLLGILLNTRSNYFNPPAMTSPIDQLAQHAAPYISVVLLAGSLSAALLLAPSLQASSRYKPIQSLRILSVIYLVVLPLVLLGVWSMRMDSVLLSKTSPNYYRYSEQIKIEQRAKLINRLTTSSEKAWAGPFEFSVQLNLESTPATRYTFYAPWVDRSHKFRSEFIHQLDTERPKVIYFGEYYHEGKPYSYSREVKDFLENQYFQVSDPALHFYYFSNHHKVSILNELRNYGYKTD